MIDDAELLRRYSELRSETAFSEFVERHVGLVYHTSLRRTGDSTMAQEIAQSVFSTVARKSVGLTKHPSLTAWLFTTTRHVADRAMRKEETRRRYETDAAMHELTTAEPSLEWERLGPVIDEALERLNQIDREAILLRFFDGQTYADMAAALRISPDAARMRVERALDKLRTRLERDGIRSASAALAVVLSTQAGVAVPAGMIMAISGAALTTTTATGGAAVLFGFMSATKTTLAAAAVATILATGFGIVEKNRAHEAQDRLIASNQENASLRSNLALAERRISQAETRASEADKDSANLLAAVEAARVKQAAAANSAAKPLTRRASLLDDPATRNLAAMFPNGVVATVGDKTITVDDVGMEIAPLLPKLQQEARDPKEFRQQLSKLQNDVVKALVERSLLVKEFNTPAENEAPRHIDAPYVEQFLADRLREKFSNDPTKLAAYLESRGMTREDYRKTLEEDIAYQYMRHQQRKLETGAEQTKHP